MEREGSEEVATVLVALERRTWPTPLQASQRAIDPLRGLAAGPRMQVAPGPQPDRPVFPEGRLSSPHSGLARGRAARMAARAAIRQRSRFFSPSPTSGISGVRRSLHQIPDDEITGLPSFHYECS